MQYKKGIKHELDGEYQNVKKLNKLQSYLNGDLEKYQDLVEVPEGIEYIIWKHKKVKYLAN